MKTVELTSKEYFKGLRTVHLALLLSIISFTIITFFLNYKGQISSDNGYLTNIFYIVVPALFACCIIASVMIHKKGLKKIKLKNSLGDKLEAYQSLFIKRFALLEAPSFFGIIVFLLTANKLFLSYVVFTIILFILFRPTKDKVVMELELESQDRESINNPDAIVARFTVK